MSHQYEQFDDYFLEVENYGTRSERFYNDIDIYKDDPFALQVIMLSWLKAAFDSARLEKQNVLQYSEQYDAYYNSETNEWTEDKCDDPNCEFCGNRPDKPL